RRGRRVVGKGRSTSGWPYPASAGTACRASRARDAWADHASRPDSSALPHRTVVPPAADRPRLRFPMAQTDPRTLDQLCVNTIRTLCIDAVQKANSGHPGTPMGMAPVVYCLWQRFLRFDPDDPIWPNRDRFVLSAGHASTLLYSMLHLTGVKAVDPDYE